MKRQTSIALLLMFLMCGCNQGGRGNWTGPSAPAPLTTASWKYHDKPGRVITSRHYELYTTIENEKFVNTLAQTLEAAYSQYHMLTPSTPQNTEPMKCYVFSKRPEWQQFTIEKTGPEANIYLQITRGGYTIGDWFVAYYIGDAMTCSVTAHEGWHQYVARHFKGHLPPFLEEGTATLFEDVRFVKDLPRWDLSINPNRVQKLRHTIERRKLWPLEKLITMHAGDIVNLPGDRIEAFYSQNWAFARFLWDGDGGAYRTAFQKLLDDTAAGMVRDPRSMDPAARAEWSPQNVKPILEHYLGMDLAAIDRRYQEYIRDVAFKQLADQLKAAP